MDAQRNVGSTGAVEGHGQAARVPPGVDVTTPSVARMYDYYLGGKDNYAADRAAAEEVAAAVPEVPALARANRAFLRRAVRFLAGECGIRQFLDLGTGLPTQENVHQVAQAVNPACRVVYVDHDPVVLVHARALLATNAQTIVVQADLRDPASVLKHPDTQALIDFDQPVGVLAVAVLHFVEDFDDPAGLVAAYREALAPGSYVAITHVTWGWERAEAASAAAEVYQRATQPIVLRTPAQIGDLLAGLDLVPPGLVEVQDWRPDGPAAPLAAAGRVLAGVGRRP